MKTWRERIVLARQRGCFTKEDKSRASKWTTCAVGEQYDAMPHVVIYMPTLNPFQKYEPQDETLSELGGGMSGFYRAIVGDSFDDADRILDKIEDRVLELKRSV